MRCQGCGLGDLVQVVLSCSVATAASQSLVLSCGGASGDSSCFHSIENIAVGIAGQRGRRAGTKLIRALQSEGGDMRPVRELRLLGEVRWRRLIIPRGSSKNERNWCISRSIVASQSQNTIRDSLTDTDALRR